MRSSRLATGKAGIFRRKLKKGKVKSVGEKKRLYVKGGELRGKFD